jgi:hypothetical protein
MQACVVSGPTCARSGGVQSAELCTLQSLHDRDAVHEAVLEGACKQVMVVCDDSGHPPPVYASLLCMLGAVSSYMPAATPRRMA